MTVEVTLCLCQMQARSILKGADIAGSWLLFIGSAMPDKKYKPTLTVVYQSVRTKSVCVFSHG